MTLPFKIAANTLIQIIGRIVGSGITFLITILLARHFGMAGFGDFIKITSFVAIFYLVADFGFNAIFLRDLPAGKASEKNVRFHKFLGTRVFFASFLMLLAIIIPLLLPFNESLQQGFTPFVRLGILIYSLTILTQAVFVTANSVFQRKLRYDLSVFASSLGQLVTLIIVSILLLLKASLLSILTAFLLGGTVSAILSLILARGEVGSVRLSFDWQFIKKLTLKTLPLGATLVFNIIYFRADSFLLTLMRPTHEVGIYGLAFKFFELPLALPTFFGNAIYPILLQTKRRKSFKKIIFLSSIVLLSSSLVVVFIFWLASPLLSLVRGDFTSSILPFRILILSLPLFFLSSLYQWVLIAQGRQKILAFIYFFSMVLNIALNLLFIPRYSYIAASIITGVCEGIVFILILMFVVKSLKINSL